MAGQGPSVEAPVRGIVLTTIEELLETAGVSLRVGALLAHLRDRGVARRVADGGPSAEGEEEPPQPLRLLSPGER